jgi:hypothetical protein
MRLILLYLLSFLFLLGAVVNAQTESESDIINQPMIGITGGLTLNSFSGDAPKNFGYSGTAKFTFGLNGEIPIGKGIKIGLQPRYLQSGTKLVYDAGKDVYIDSLQADLNYISVPVFIKVLAFNNVTYFTSGVDLGFLMKANMKTIQNDTTPDKDISSSIQKFNLQVFFGAGVRFRIGLPELNIEARYSVGFTNAYNGENATVTSFPARFTLGGFQLLANINFPLTKSAKGR